MPPPLPRAHGGVVSRGQYPTLPSVGPAVCLVLITIRRLFYATAAILPLLRLLWLGRDLPGSRLFGQAFMRRSIVRANIKEGMPCRPCISLVSLYIYALWYNRKFEWAGFLSEIKPRRRMFTFVARHLTAGHLRSWQKLASVALQARHLFLQLLCLGIPTRYVDIKGIIHTIHSQIFIDILFYWKKKTFIFRSISLRCNKHKSSIDQHFSCSWVCILCSAIWIFHCDTIVKFKELEERDLSAQSNFSYNSFHVIST